MHLFTFHQIITLFFSKVQGEANPMERNQQESKGWRDRFREFVDTLISFDFHGLIVDGVIPNAA